MPRLTVRHDRFQDLHAVPFPHLGPLRRITEDDRQIPKKLSGTDVFTLLSSDEESELKPVLCPFSIPS